MHRYRSYDRIRADLASGTARTRWPPDRHVRRRRRIRIHWLLKHGSLGVWYSAMTTASDRAKSWLSSAVRMAGPKPARFGSLSTSLVAALAVAAFAGAAHAEESLRGSGTTFVAPFLTEAFAQYALLKRGPFSIGYRAVGSGAGIADFIARRVDFCATDVPMKSREVGEAD